MNGYKIVIDVHPMDVTSCPRCRWEVPEGMVCKCPMQTRGPAVEPVLPRLANGRMAVE